MNDQPSLFNVNEKKSLFGGGVSMFEMGDKVPAKPLFFGLNKGGNGEGGGMMDGP